MKDKDTEIVHKHHFYINKQYTCKCIILKFVYVRTSYDRLKIQNSALPCHSI